MAEYKNGLKDNLDFPKSSITVLESRYLKKDSSGNLLETGEQLMQRVAKDIASAEVLYLDELEDKIEPNITREELYALAEKSDIAKEKEKEFLELMTSGKFLPNSPTLMNAGRKLQQLSACFVLPIEDSIDTIFDTQKQMAIVHKSGGGTGFSFNRLRPNGAFIKSTSGYSPGPLSFLFTFNESAGQITQGGKRRGANMGILRANHPDAYDFAKVKQQEKLLANFNLSIAFSDSEIEAIKNDNYILMEDPRKIDYTTKEKIKYTVKNAEKRNKEIIYGKGDKFETSWELSPDQTKLIDRETKEEIGKVENNLVYIRAKKLFDIIIKGAWQKGEPGIVFIDKINKFNPTPEVGEIESTNPCGEQPLLPYESCNLGSINVSKMVKNSEIDYNLFEKTIRSVTRFMDNVVDRNNYPLKEIAEITKSNRKIGIGVMGFAHMLIKLRIRYDSKEAITKAKEIMSFLNKISKDESRKLAIQRGVFPNFYKSIYKNNAPIRNATTTTIAPTGTIGVIAATSQGIEPIFQYISIRHVKDTIGEDLVEIDTAFKEYLEENKIYSEELIKKIAKQGIDIPELENYKKEIKDIFVTAHEVTPEQHLQIQAAFQEFTDNAVSKTINMPNKTTKEEIAQAYLRAHELGCKGLTVYRDGSRTFELLTDSKTKKENISKKRPRLIGTTIKQITPHGWAFITLNGIQDESFIPYEAFVTIGKGGRDIHAISEGMGRLISMALQNKVPFEEIIKQLRGISGETQTGFGPNKIGSLPDAIAKGLKEAYEQLNETNIQKTEPIKKEPKTSGNFCPDCGRMLMNIEGCQKCTCGFSRC
ncbi:MAG: adenosylcobalamin-dependent ribonucleoside-diphosphate reductase [Candidatus Pacearchaeota archaeon]|nr:adenosylcobalamin-dependent ribonucleoside-diphosphate reductase [Candidatus Pacearchaeota archaeon]